MAQEEFKNDLFKNELPLTDDYPFWLRAPFRLLTDVTQFRKVDPWDLEVADLITQFVKRMKEFDDINFPVLGRAILSAAILYRTKVTDLIRLIEATDDRTKDLEILDFDIPEISPSYHISQRPVTFNELIFAFEGLLKQESRYKHRLVLDKRKALIQPLQLPAKPIRLVDEESSKIAKLKKDIYNRLVKLYSTRKKPIPLEDLILPNSNRVSIVNVFLCILFLHFELKAKITQKEELGRLFIIPIRDNEEEFLGGLEKIIEDKLRNGLEEESVIISEITEDEEFLVETDQIFEDDEDNEYLEDEFENSDVEELLDNELFEEENEKFD
ncbi:MAG: hypothetical protein JXA54_05350 [Candidatus Heimdallarchaeota archaeon]|nr:hypothetical protein [Candidatus Heimdallarchaeota archaeon]